MIKTLVKFGNKKIGRDTIIFSITSATDCPSKAKGLCKIPEGKCYAFKDEKRYCRKDLPNCLDKKRRQAKYWNETDVYQMIKDLNNTLQRTKKVIKYFRLNESGDFRSQDDIEKLKKIAGFFPEIKFYTYTHRRDLTFKRLPKNININFSNFKRRGFNSFYAVKEYSGKNLKCKGDCRICNLCKVKHGKIIENKYH